MALKLDALTAVTSKDKIDNGAWLHFRSPIIPPGEDQGPLLYLRKPDGSDDISRPVRAKVRSVRSGHFRSRNLSLQTVSTSKASRARSDQRDEVIRMAVEKERPHQFSYLVNTFENVSSDAPGEQQPTEQELFDLAHQSEYQWIVDQTMNFAFTDSNYGSEEEVAAAAKGNAAPAGAPESGASKP